MGPKYPGGIGIDYDYDLYDEILEFHPDTEEWILAGRMIEARGGHAVSTINFEDVRDVCNNSHFYSVSILLIIICVINVIIFTCY